MKEKIISIITLLFFSFAAIAANTYYVAPTGNDTTGNGTTANRYATVSKGVSVLGNGDTLIVGDGTYTNEYYVTNALGSGQGYTIQGESADYSKVLITANCGSSNINWLVLPVITMKDLTLNFDGTASNPKAGVENSMLKWGNGSGTSTFVRVFFNATNWEGFGYKANGLVRGSSGGSAANFYKCTFRGFASGASDTQAIRSLAETITINDSIFKNNTYCWTPSSTPTIDYNDYYNNTNQPAPSAHDITTDPNFSAANSAVLNAGSPCIDTGVTVANWVTTYTGTAPDMGAYEVPAASSGTTPPVKTGPVSVGGVINSIASLYIGGSPKGAIKPARTGGQ